MMTLLGCERNFNAFKVGSYKLPLFFTTSHKLAVAGEFI